jgi:hypothetical protein
LHPYDGVLGVLDFEHRSAVWILFGLVLYIPLVLAIDGLDVVSASCCSCPDTLLDHSRKISSYRVPSSFTTYFSPTLPMVRTQATISCRWLVTRCLRGSFFSLWHTASNDPEELTLREEHVVAHIWHVTLQLLSSFRQTACLRLQMDL